MKKISIIAFSFLLIFSSCRENEDITEVQITLPDAEELGGVDLNGRLTNEFGEGVPQTTVDLYRDGEEYAVTTTNDEGYYSFTDLDYTEASQYLWTKVEGLHRTYSAYEMSGTPVDEVDVALETTLHTPLVNGSLTNFTLTEGVLKNNNGEAVRGKFVVFDNNQEIFSYGDSNAEGVFSAISPVNEEFSLVLLDRCGNILAQNNLDPQISNRELGIFNNAETATPIVISGTLVDEDNAPVVNGVLIVKYDSSGQVNEIRTDAQGNFTFKTFECLIGNNISYQAMNYQGEDTQRSPFTTLDYEGGDINLGLLQTESTSSKYRVDYSFKGTMVSYYNHYIKPVMKADGEVEYELRGLAGENQITFNFPQISTGAQEAKNLKIIHSDPALSALGPEGTSNVTFFVNTISLENGVSEVIGNISGNFFNQLTNQTENLSGTFRLPVFE